jgi:tripartite-type tricarboxylate transporter receptor subunit TctC
MRRWLLAVGFALASVAGASAQNFPTRPITVIVPFPAGGPTDAILRNVGDRMRASLGQPVVAEYVTGASGTIGVARGARAAPDGYTIVCGHVGTFVTGPAVYPVQYDVVKDFTPISLLPSNSYLIVGSKKLPAQNLRELIAYIKANPGKVTAAIPGIGTSPHLSGLQIQNLAGSTLQFVPYRGTGPAMIDLMAGQIDLMIDQAQNSVNHVRSGAVKGYAVAAPTRLAAMPDLPTVDEAGAPGLYVSLWYGFWAPAGTPEPIVKKLTAAVQYALADREVQTRLADLGMDVPSREEQTPEALAAKQKAEIEKWWPIIKAAGLRIQ